MSSNKPASNKPVREMSVTEISNYVHSEAFAREDLDAVNERLRRLDAKHRYAPLAGSPDRVEAYYI